MKSRRIANKNYRPVGHSLVFSVDFCATVSLMHMDILLFYFPVEN
jgi:hypothetical protein